MGLPYELSMLPFPPRERARDYLTLNPLGTVPLLIDGEVHMTESAAICQYLVTRYGPTPLAVDATEPAYAAWLNALHQGEATLTFPQTLVLRYGRFEPTERRQPQVVEDYGRWFIARLKWIDGILAKAHYVAADRFTAADISVGYALMLAGICGLADRFPAAVAEYWHRLSRRNGHLRALETQRRASAAQSVDAWL
jgi:glutathione S-transferase